MWCRNRCIAVACVAVVLMAAAVLAMAPILRPPAVPRSPCEVFREHVCDPIPQSVTDVKLDQPDKVRTLFANELYVMRFKINKVDLMSIVNARPFKEFDWVEYVERQDGVLHWGRGSHPFGLHDMGLCLLYAPAMGVVPPDWFKPNEWQSPKVFVRERVGGKDRTQILIYDEDLSEAYFIEHHHWGF